MGQQRTSRYDEIVADLRRRIETGELAPGDRIPSTRDIIREWGVAMATATKVLTQLRHEGLAQAVPGVGTVVTAASRPAAGGRGRPGPGARQSRRRDAAEPPLTTEQIVTSAIAVADAEGLAAVSMRRVATELGAAPMSLYRHVSDKDDLLVRMMDVAFAEARLPATAPESWRQRLELAARLLWGSFRRHPWVAPALSLTRPQLITSAMPYTEWVLTALDGHGLDFQTIFTIHLALLNYVRGTAINMDMEAEAEALTGLNNEEWLKIQEPKFESFLDSGRFPAFARLATAGYDFDLDGLFDFGLQRLLDGIATILNASKPDVLRPRL